MLKQRITTAAILIPLVLALILAKAYAVAYEIEKHGEGIYAVLDVNCEPATIKEMDRQLALNESVLRTKVMRRDPAAATRRGKAGAA